jgi:hypothetical protein
MFLTSFTYFFANGILIKAAILQINIIAVIINFKAVGKVIWLICKIAAFMRISLARNM